MVYVVQASNAKSQSCLVSWDTRKMSGKNSAMTKGKKAAMKMFRMMM